MARKTKLSWFPPRRQWRKRRKIDGKVKTWYLGEAGTNKTDLEAYRAAVAEWEQIEAELEADEAEAERQALREQHRELHQRATDTQRAIIEGEPDADWRAFDTNRRAAEAAVYGDPEFSVPVQATRKANTIAEQIEEFRNTFDGQVGLGQRSNDRAVALKHHLYRFRDWTPEDNGQAVGNMPASAINARLLSGYHTHLAQLIAAKGKEHISHRTGRDALAAAKQFIRWLFEMEAITAPPRNIDSRALNIRVPTTEAKHWTLDEIRTLLGAATERGELYLLLGLNCGMTQVDLSDLKPREFDPKAGTIERKRSKTEEHEGVPVVRYTLWPRTLELLKKFRQAKGDRLLLTERGSTLVGDNRRDAVKLTLNRLLAKLEKAAKAEAEERKEAGDEDATPDIIGGSFKLLRATGADLLEHENGFKAVVGLYLGHAPATVAERHYTRGDQALLDKAVAWLGDQVGE